LPSLILLTDYMRHCIVCIRTTWTTCQDLPTRFIKNINDTLAEEMTVGVVAALFHLAVSGDCFAPVKEWLTSELSDRVNFPYLQSGQTSSHCNTGLQKMGSGRHFWISENR